MSSRKKRKAQQEDCAVCIIHSPKSNSENLVSCSVDYFEKLLDIKWRRLESTTEALRMADVCVQIPSTFSEGLGYHRDCYQKFTMNMSRLPTPPQSIAGSSDFESRRRRSLDPDKIIFRPDCIFCEKEGRKKVKVRGTWTTDGTIRFEYDGGVTLQRIAQEKHDEHLLTRIRGVDLFACEALYHPSCRNKYCQNPEKWRSKDEDSKERQSHTEKAHREAFDIVKSFIERFVILGKSVVKLNELREIYVSKLAETEFSNPNYRSENLKVNLDKTYGKKIMFIKMETHGKFESYLVASSDIDLESAIRCAYDLGSADKISDTASLLRQEINDMFQSEGSSLSWPPTAKYLNDLNFSLPEKLEHFLTSLLTGKKIQVTTPKVARLVNSIGQDICRAVTHGSWKLPKHILLCMALRHWFRSAEITTLLNRLGHSETYSFSLELETSIAIAVETTSTLLSPQIVRNPNVPFLFHSDFDNFDQLLNDLHGMASVHTSHGIMLQDFSCPASQEVEGDMPSMPVVHKSGIRSLKLETQEVLPDCYLTHRRSPSYEVEKTEMSGTEGLFELECKKDLLWVMARYLSSYLEQELPGLAGFWSVLGDEPPRLTIIDYYPVINQPITDNKAVQECLRYSEQGAREVGQKYVVTTFDLGVCMKAYPIIWNQPKKFEDHIIMIGTFHVVCAYFKMIGKKMEGTGLSDILLEAGLIGSGSVTGVMTGKHYSRAMHCHKILLEALERLLFEEFCFSLGEERPMMGLPDDSFELLKTLVDEPDNASFESALNNENISSYIDAYAKFRHDARTGHLGKTAQLWVSYMDHIWLVLQLTKAVKTNNFLLYARCLFLMCDLFFSFGGQNYARYLTFFSVFLANIETSHPGATDLLKRGAISVARSFVPGNRCPVDKTIEETFMKHSKSHGGAGGGSAGLSGLLSNYDAYQRWVRAAHERVQFVKGALAMVDMLADDSDAKKHRDLRRAEIERSEANVVKVAEAIVGFINPFEMEQKDKLYCISSGASATSEIERDVMLAEAFGADAKVAFISERLEKNEKFFDPIKRLNLKTLSELAKKTTIKSSQNKIIEYRQQSNIAFQLLVRSQCDDLRIDLHELLAYPLTPVPYSIATSDGFLNKTDKSKGYHFLTKDVEDVLPPPDDKTLVIEDGNAAFHYLKDLPPNFRDICARLFDMVVRKSDIIFSTDMYLENSIKSMERKRRGCSEKLIVTGENTKKPPDWKTFLANEENKKQLIELLCRVWSTDNFAPKLLGKNVITVSDGHAFHITSYDGTSVCRTEIKSIESTQEETDSRVVLYCFYGKQQGYINIRIRSPDTDIFFILLHYALELQGVTILFDTGTGNKKRLIDITKLAQQYQEELCTALLGLHAFTRCDTTSAFKGIGKVKPIKTLQKSPQFQSALAQIGNSWQISEDLFLQMEAFTCLLYGGKEVSCVNDLRYNKIRGKCCSTGETFDASKNIDLGVLPPCRNCLREHLKRVNYQVGIWKRAHIAKPIYPEPTHDNGWKCVDGMIEPKWVSGDFIPQQLADVLVEENIVGLTESDESDDEFDDVLYSLIDGEEED